VRKLILKCGLAPGDIVMLTAAVRDLHRCYPRRFLTDVRTACADLWDNNPYISPLSDRDPTAEHIDCAYPLINRCDKAPYHCLHGFVEFLNKKLGLSIQPTAFKGDIYLSPQEKAWFSRVHELTGEATPFWIIDAGGKYDVTIKWWQPERYQDVVNQFRGKIQFVQIGQEGHYHPKLDGVIDLRGQTSLRQLVRLVYHAQGVLCPVTSLMHLAAAVPTRPGQPAKRPCVVVAGGREPAHWEAYPGHQFIHTNEALACCANGGCWRDRTLPLHDGDSRDRSDRRCVSVIQGLPRCMDMITPDEVVRRIELYFSGGRLNYLGSAQAKPLQKAIKATRRNAFDQLPLNLHSAGMACEAFIDKIPPYPQSFQGRGIVICGGGLKYFTCAWVCIHMLRRLGCDLPIELWHLGAGEMSLEMAALVRPLGVECIDACDLRKRFPARILHGWALKPYAILHSQFREVLLLDADNVPTVDPGYLFETPEFLKSGAIFWPDYKFANGKKARAIWRSCGLRAPREREFESGQIAVDKRRCWRALCLSMWFNENADFYYRYVHGDKETFHLAFRKLKQRYSLVRTSIHPLTATMCQHDFEGRRVFQHRNMDKWNLFLHNKQVNDFWFESECRQLVARLQHLWDGSIDQETAKRFRNPATCRPVRKPLKIKPMMISCAQREKLRQRTLENLAGTDWVDVVVNVQVDEGAGVDRRRRQTLCAYKALQESLQWDFDYMLFLEDDLEFNRHIRHNLENWPPLRDRQAKVASVYNPSVREFGCDARRNARLVDPACVFGSQALLIAKSVVKFAISNWHTLRGMQDIRISRLAGRLGSPIFYHAPSLVQHVGRRSTWGGGFHRALDFDANWRA
jgi:ADP-heptose:LPS heptosyltransferase